MRRRSSRRWRARAVLAVGAALLCGALPLGAQRVDLPAGDALQASRDSFAAYAPSGIVGTMRLSVARTASGGWRVSELISVDEVLELATVSRTGATLRLEQFAQSGVAFGREVLAELGVTNGRLRGQVMSPDGARLTTLDLAAPDAPDLTLLPALLAAVSWRDGATGAWPMLRPTSGEAVTVAIVCEGPDTVTVRNTALPAWRVRATVGAQVTRYWVSATAPTRVLAVATDGLPFRFVAR